MELVKRLYTTTNSQTEKGMKRKKKCLSYSDFNRWGSSALAAGDERQRQFCADFSIRLFCLCVCQIVFVIDNGF